MITALAVSAYMTDIHVGPNVEWSKLQNYDATKIDSFLALPITIGQNRETMMQQKFSIL